MPQKFALFGRTLGRTRESVSAIEEIGLNVHQAATGSSEVAANITDVNRGAARPARHRLRC